PRQQDEGKVRPFRLLLEPRRQRPQVSAVDRLLGDDGEARPRRQMRDQVGQARTYLGSDAGFRQHGGGDGRVASVRRQDHRPLGEVRNHVFRSFSNSSPSPVIVGTPRSTPWNFVSGWPTVSPLPSSWYSRIVFSCALVRFFTTEMARRTLPIASK